MLNSSAGLSGRRARHERLARALGGGFKTLVAYFSCAERVAISGRHQKHIFLAGAHTLYLPRGAA